MSQKFNPKTFQISTLNGLSAKNIEEHLKLYQAYVNHTNSVLEKITELATEAEKNMPLLSGLQKRFGFEYNGMRNHEVYFENLSGGPSPLEKSDLLKAFEEEWGSYENWLELFKALATTRGIGWAILYWDKENEKLLNAWVDEQHLGQLQNCLPLVALDMWEHAYLLDYPATEKKKYIEAFFTNLNWQKIADNFKMKK